ncbi:Rrf2 family transcriptional regulator [Paenibacillus sp. IHBB 10380]|uniref:Rrf2 family transcriptional regulator n=1 Tax=Paenibacillus sp. IHBB 10380 TaxID=1566358 RepID=UPI0005CFA556|nr:Rrf2 family transcriptional regulator [Paenibacillus sp. IHBB 10380]AJS59518.1 Rrf2 family transcriptional regulator [Paenibacillus sp. IHBB 10380]
MAISSRFAVGIHILSLLEINKTAVNTSEFIAGSVNTNPVVIRRIMGMLHKAGLVNVRPGVAGAKLARNVEDITLLDVYKAVSAVEENELFSVHNAPNPDCLVGRNIQSSIEPLFSAAQQAMEDKLKEQTVKQVVYEMAQHGNK